MRMVIRGVVALLILIGRLLESGARGTAGSRFGPLLSRLAGMGTPALRLRIVKTWAIRAQKFSCIAPAMTTNNARKVTRRHWIGR